MNTFLSYLAIGLSAGLVYGLLALGLVLVYKGTRVLNFAHPYFGLQTAFLAWWLTAKASYPPFSWIPFGANTLPRFAIALVLSLAFIALNGWLIERTIMHHLRNASRLIQLVATIALAQGAVGFVTLLFARNDEQAADFRALPRVLDGLSFASVRRLQQALKYGAVASGDIEVLDVYTTDGRLLARRMQVAQQEA